MRARNILSPLALAAGLVLLAQPALAMDGIPHNGGGGAPPPGAPTPDAARIYASLQNAIADDSRWLRDAILGRLHGAQGGGTVAWVHGHDGWGRLSGSGDTFKRTSVGGLFGLDAGAGRWRLGAVAGASDTSAGLGSDGSRAGVHGIHGGLYAGGDLSLFRLSAGAGFSRHRLDVSRIDISAAPDAYGARFNGDTRQAFAELAVPLRSRVALVEPYASAAWVEVRSRGFTETGGTPSASHAGVFHAESIGVEDMGSTPVGALALTSAGATRRTGSSDLGARFSTPRDAGGSPWTLDADLGWRRVWSGRNGTSAMTWSGGAISGSGLPLSRDAALVRLGLGRRLGEGGWVRLGYDGVLGSGQRDQGVLLTTGVRF